MENLKEFWNQQSSRDQLYMVVLGGCVALYILFMVVYKPVKNMRDTQIKQYEGQMASLERIKALAAQYQAKTSGKGNQRSGSIDGLVQASLSKNALRASAMDSSGKNTLRVRIESGNFENVLAWLYDIEISQGMQIKDISVAAGETPGTVSINSRIQKD